MAKKLIHRYRIDTDNNSVIIPDNVHKERLLLITDVDAGTMLYNFADPTSGATSISYDNANGETTIVLEKDFTTYGVTDATKLQIFIEKDETIFEPSETFVDPVSKLRVSNPENLIDTDFEYGLQTSKWETLQTVNNIPTIFTSNGDVPIDGVESMTVTAGSKQVTVRTSQAHGLELGDPISVQGVTEFLAEGVFLVSGVASSREFYYETDQAVSFTGTINGSYTNIIPSNFFEGSSIHLDEESGQAIISDGNTPSTLTVATDETHGLYPGSKLYLRNTVGPKDLTITDVNATAPDGRPYVDSVERLVTTQTIDANVPSGRIGIYDSPAISYDWQSTYNLPVTEAERSGNNILWTAHGMKNNYCLLFSSTQRGETNGGLTDGTVYYVNVVDADTIYLSASYGSTTPVTLTTFNSDRGPCILNLVYKAEGKNGYARKTPFLTRNVATYSKNYNVARSGTSSYTYSQLIGSVAELGNITKVTLDRIYYSGDLNASSEYITMTYYNKNYLYNGSNRSYRVGGAGRTSGNLYPNMDLTPHVFQSGGNWYIQANYNPTASVGGTWYVYHYWTVTSTAAVLDENHSGSDFATKTWGLGGQAPSKIVAFQGRTAGSYANSTERYSYLANQRTNGRYANTGVAYGNTYYGNGTDANGNLYVNYNDSGDYTNTGMDVYYAMVKEDTAFRNTIYVPAGHGLTDGQEVSINVTGYDGGSQSFAFADGNKNMITITSATVPAVVSVVSPTLIRLQLSISPFTDDMVRFPNQFTISSSVPNPTFNTLYVQNHKITSSATAVYIAGTSPIGGLTNNTTYLLERATDSRLKLSETTVSQAQTAVSDVYGSDSASPFTVDIDIETLLGVASPTTASITAVQFRGDFSQDSEYVTLTFEDGYEFDVGVRGEDSFAFAYDETWSTKDISNLLKTLPNGKKGITVTFDATSNTVNAPYGPFLRNGRDFEIKFTISGQSGSILITPSTAAGTQTFEAQAIQGAYDGIYTLDDAPTSSSFVLPLDFKAPSRTFNFTSADMNDGANTITLATTPSRHNMITGEKVLFSTTGTTILPNNDTADLYAIVIDSFTIALAGSYLDAINNFRMDIDGLAAGTHTITTPSLLKTIEGFGTVSITQNTNTVIGNGTSFLTNYKRNDEFFVITGGFMQKYIVDKILTDEKMELKSIVPNETVSATYYYTTQVIPRPDGYSLHKSFDGGIEITAGTSPFSKITRQTRKYFRYQSGKGIQNSFAINFSPTRILNQLTAVGTTATAKTQEVHNLQVGEIIRIYDAEVSIGDNFYDGIKTVTAVPSAYEFQYEMDGTPDQSKAAGFPSYAREGWRDSAVRAGMFDDQNGFFFEYDGTDLYCVRRSSTLQLSGTVNTTNGSHVIKGNGTSFTTQIVPGDKIVVRGQSYKVIEVSSDSRVVVQPSYRGVTANKIKLTKTVDTKVAQRDWSYDPCDGTGPTGYDLDIHKIQMAYCDYSWYGAGKIRFGFKDQNGHVKYMHEFVHNNKLLESYFRSGNLPGRYEIENGANPNTAPSLFHFGTSVIMDGTFDDDKAYLFSNSSKPFVFTNGSSSTFTSGLATTFEQITLNQQRVYVYAIPVQESVAQQQTVGSQLSDPAGTFPEGTYIAQVVVEGSNSKIYASYPGTLSDPAEYSAIAAGSVFTTGETTPVDLTRPIPLVSLRLAPSVDSGVTGKIGEREIINRMQLALKAAGITTNRDVEAFIILNASPSNLDFEKVQNPSLSEIIRHKANDTLQGGTIIYSTKTSAGSADIDLSALIDMGNCIMGGDSIFPAGPDLITVAIQPQDTSTISGANPMFASGKITWTESQA